MVTMMRVFITAAFVRLNLVLAEQSCDAASEKELLDIEAEDALILADDLQLLQLAKSFEALSTNAVDESLPPAQAEFNGQGSKRQPSGVIFSEDEVSSKRQPGGMFEFEEFSGWAANPALYSVETSPCDIDTFVQNVPVGDGYYIDRGEAGGWCKTIPARNVAAVRCHHSAHWISSATGKTYLPNLNWAGVQFQQLCGWAEDLSLYGSVSNPCDMDNFESTLGGSDGYYMDVGVANGWCRIIPQQNFWAIRSAHSAGGGQWHPSVTGVTYLK